MSRPILILIAGGIGSGKSVVSTILRKLGYQVYDCDSQAKILINITPSIHSQLCNQIHPLAVENGIVNRPLIAKIVFNDSDALRRLNNITHQAVISDIHKWIAKYPAETHLFIETAIPITSGIYNMVDETWQVEAPLDVRIRRVQQRSNLTATQIQARIASQSTDILPQHTPNLHTINNHPSTPLLPQLPTLLQ